MLSLRHCLLRTSCLLLCLAVSVMVLPTAARATPDHLQEGDSGEAVVALQELLRQTGDFELEPTGYFGPVTTAALISFQARHGLEPDGIAGAETWAALELAALPVSHTVATGETLGVIAAQYGLSIGDLVAYNDLPDPDWLQVGDVLRLVPPAAPPPPDIAAEPAAPTDPVTVPTVDTTPGIVTVFGPDSGTGRIALTFNDGPDADITPQVLDLLKQSGVRATFFIVGDKATAQPDLLKRIVSEGHELASHTQTHRELAGLDLATVRAELTGPRDAAAAAGLTLSRWFRPPGGRWDDTVLQAAGQEGMRLALWTNIGPQQLTAPLMARRALSAARPGAVLLLHDTRKETVEALTLILAGLQEKGLQAVTLSELHPGQ